MGGTALIVAVKCVCVGREREWRGGSVCVWMSVWV